MKRNFSVPAICLLVSAVMLINTGAAIAVSPPAPAAPGSTFAQRLDQRKAERGITLSQNDQSRLTGACANVQATIRPIQANMVTVLAARTKVYQQVDAKLWVAIGELKLAGKDTFTLEKDRSTLADKTNSFQTLSTNFSQTLDDIGVINCAADPVGFRALLDTAQQYYAQIRAQSADSLNYVVNTIKPELATHISDLQAKASTDSGDSN